MRKLYPSSVTPAFGHTTNSYKESCPRYYAMKEVLPDTDVQIDDLYKAIGRIAEEHMRIRIEQTKKPEEEILIESPVRVELRPGWMLSGRMDAFIRNLTDPSKNEVRENKATISFMKNKRVFQEGQPDINHLGQLITYMAMTETRKGMLTYVSLSFTESLSSLKFRVKDFRIFIDGDHIFLDGEYWDQHTVSDYLRFYALMIDSYEKIDLPAKTMNGRACISCPFNHICDANPQSKEEFKALFSELGEGRVKAMPQPKIPVTKTKRRT